MVEYIPIIQLLKVIHAKKLLVKAIKSMRSLKFKTQFWIIGIQYSQMVTQRHNDVAS